MLLRRVNSHIEFVVSDTGIGISSTFLPHVFDRFSQKDSCTSRRYGGLGLGLAISKQLAELHGGSIRVSSPGEGQGSTFIVHLPLSLDTGTGADQQHPTHAIAQESTVVPSLAGVQIMVVDDEPDAREFIQRVLQEQGATVVSAHSAEDALYKLETQEPDILLGDIGMPVMDGYQLVRRIRAVSEARAGCRLSL